MSASPTPPQTFTTFAGTHRIATGSLADNRAAAARYLADGAPGSVLTFADASGEQVDLDWRSPPAAAPEASTAIAADDSEAAPPRGRGRPRLGVVAREVTLLPRQWEWLAGQPGGASVTLRKLVEQARRADTGAAEQRRLQERTYRFLNALAGDLPAYEEALRALFAGDVAAMLAHMQGWPADIRDYARQLATPASDPAASAGQEGSDASSG